MRPYLLVTGVLFGMVGVAHGADVAERWRTIWSQPLQLAVPLAGIALTIWAWRSMRSGKASLARGYALISGAVFTALAGEHVFQFVRDVRAPEKPWFIAANVLVLLIAVGLALWGFRTFRGLRRA
jgi:protein-S-isoprenylcysteine O-methyltransferase Ste14